MNKDEFACKTHMS